MRIRPANLVDIESCQRLDGSYTTDYVWRMEERVGDDTASVTFRRVHIPRQITVAYPRSLDTLPDDWQRRECFLVADDLGRIIGFLDMLVHRWRWRAQVEHLVVDRAYRGRGVASHLLRAAERWARGSQMQSIEAILQNKNDPAIRILQQRGYRFQGFLDDYFENGDIGMVFRLYLL
ncbi:MAG: GNAT family N-acetyltransferase [Chloroflexi bacterium]|nr:GNAT family N-acetyltransferase [Chloroflexota bacterium]